MPSCRTDVLTNQTTVCARIVVQAVVLTAIRAMEALAPLPRMFMRTVIQALKGAPRLRVEVGQLLERLVAKQVS